MRRSSDFGISSMIFGGLSIPLLLVAQHAKMVWRPQGGYVLNWLDQHGFVKPSVKFEPELAVSSVLTWTDQSFLAVLTGFGIYLATVSVLFALWAEFKQEENLYLSAGFIIGAMGITLASFSAGLATMALGALLVQWLRARRGA